MESHSKIADIKPEVLQLIKKLQDEEAQAWCDEIDVIIDRLILHFNGEDPSGTLESLQSLQSIKKIFKIIAK